MAGEVRRWVCQECGQVIYSVDRPVDGCAGCRWEVWGGRLAPLLPMKGRGRRGRRKLGERRMDRRAVRAGVEVDRRRRAPAPRRRAAPATRP